MYSGGFNHRITISSICFCFSFFVLFWVVHFLCIFSFVEIILFPRILFFCLMRTIKKCFQIKVALNSEDDHMRQLNTTILSGILVNPLLFVHIRFNIGISNLIKQTLFNYLLFFIYTSFYKI